jgi:hypothetical protein
MLGDDVIVEKKTSWKYYGVKIIKKIVIEGEPNPDLIDEDYSDNREQLFEESIMLISAQSYEHALKAAEKRAKATEVSYQNKYNEQVIWKLIRVIDCFEIMGTLVSGVEVYSRLYTTVAEGDDARH